MSMSKKSLCISKMLKIIRRLFGIIYLNMYYSSDTRYLKYLIQIGNFACGYYTSVITHNNKKHDDTYCSTIKYNLGSNIVLCYIMLYYIILLLYFF